MVSRAFTTNTEQWRQFERIITDIRLNTAALQQSVLKTFANRVMTHLFSILDAGDIDASGTWRQSLKFNIGEGGDGSPGLTIFHQPTGPSAERLPIYWKTLERGSDPIPNVPEQALQDWAFLKGRPEIGLAVANKIRREGLTPHPILSSIFRFDINFHVTSLTALGVSMLEEAVKEYGENLTTFFRRGQQVTQLRFPAGAPGGVGGQFARVLG